MALHDIGLRGLHKGEEFGVHKLWKEIKDKNKFTFARGDNTLGVIQKN